MDVKKIISTKIGDLYDILNTYNLKREVKFEM